MSFEPHMPRKSDQPCPLLALTKPKSLSKSFEATIDDLTEQVRQVALKAALTGVGALLCIAAAAFLPGGSGFAPFFLLGRRYCFGGLDHRCHRPRYRHIASKSRPELMPASPFDTLSTLQVDS
ncbi:hypothetical protein BOTBODRAFT_276056 [Botryobasidium botryosum FD-172 SS1]|uniref:Uncharacterized protein n=1 Tax=Botryobasidium botryosum (strain FD-172 SS1) TaxID=930990 RepID=A0A067MJI1_BOTB1|nr:hypothetical protein BOTBODRAFT_276056 [Botryobasidium botryosum FD-172 SS1]